MGGAMCLSDGLDHTPICLMVDTASPQAKTPYFADKNLETNQTLFIQNISAYPYLGDNPYLGESYLVLHTITRQNPLGKKTWHIPITESDSWQFGIIGEKGG